MGTFDGAALGSGTRSASSGASVKTVTYEVRESPVDNVYQRTKHLIGHSSLPFPVTVWFEVGNLVQGALWPEDTRYR